MPLLFYGSVGRRTKPRLYGVGLQPIETRVFDSFKVDELAPYSGLPHVANLWHFEDLKHTAISWHDDRGVEQTLWIPSLHSHRDALEIARAEFPDVVPSPLVFRFSNERHPHTYD